MPSRLTPGAAQRLDQYGIDAVIDQPKQPAVEMGERGADLVRDLVGNLALRLDQRGQPGNEVVGVAGQLSQLVGLPGVGDGSVQFAPLDRAESVVHRIDPAAQARGGNPGQADRSDQDQDARGKKGEPDSGQSARYGRHSRALRPRAGPAPVGWRGRRPACRRPAR